MTSGGEEKDWRSYLKIVGSWINLRDVFVFGGIAMIGYGLHQYRPWTAFVVCGALIFFVAYMPEPGEKK